MNEAQIWLAVIEGTCANGSSYNGLMTAAQTTTRVVAIVEELLSRPEIQKLLAQTQTR